MKLLLLAPHPFFIARGSPIAVDLMIRVLSDRGDHIDLLTYHEGDSPSYDNVQIHRIDPRPKVSEVPAGLSWKKIVCDVFLLLAFIRLLYSKKYDLVIAVEETSFMAYSICWLRRVPYLCDVDSSMTDQIISRTSAPESIKRRFEKGLRFLESLPIRRADGVIAVCDEIAAGLAEFDPKRLLVLKDISLIQPIRRDNRHNDEESGRDQIVMYIGNLERYQGIDLLLASFKLVTERRGRATKLVIVGGTDLQIEYYRREANELGIASQARFIGHQPLKMLAHYASKADVLVSPRTQGVNTPMKIFSYLNSGAAVLATNLPTHTQVLDDTIAMLAPANQLDFSAALMKLLDEPELRAELARNAQGYIRENHSFNNFRKALVGFFDELELSLPVRVG